MSIDALSHLVSMQVASVRPSQPIRRQDPSLYRPSVASAGTSRRRLLQTPSVEPPANFTIFRGEGSSFICTTILQHQPRSMSSPRSCSSSCTVRRIEQQRIEELLCWQPAYDVIMTPQLLHCMEEKSLLLCAGITTRAIEVNRKLRLTGKGVRVAIIDSGEHSTAVEP